MQQCNFHCNFFSESYTFWHFKVLYVMQPIFVGLFLTHTNFHLLTYLNVANLRKLQKYSFGAIHVSQSVFVK